MKNNSPKIIARRTLLKYRLWRSPSYEELKTVIESKGFVIIKYSRHNNSKDVTELIERLGVQREVAERDSFVYIRGGLGMVFLNSDMGEEDQVALLRHELGHIMDPELGINNVAHSGVKKEEFANEFSYHLKNPGLLTGLCSLIRSKSLMIASLTMLFICMGVLATGYLSKPDDAATEHTYYITSGGEKYHRSFCITIKNRKNIEEISLENAKEQDYKPCKLCIGQGEE